MGEVEPPLRQTLDSHSCKRYARRHVGQPADSTEPQFGPKGGSDECPSDRTLLGIVLEAADVGSLRDECDDAKEVEANEHAACVMGCPASFHKASLSR